MINNRKTLLLKISGESLKSSTQTIDPNKVLDLANQIKTLHTKYNIGIVLGGGNIVRGANTNDKRLNKYTAHQMGMISTIINCLYLRDVLQSLEVKTCIYSLVPIPTIAKIYDINRMNNHLKQKQEVVIFAGGTGNPYFTTDSGIALRALETSAHTILMGKNGVDGIYSDDPKKNTNAKHYKKISFSQAIKENLKVMDETAMALLKDSSVNIIIFDINAKNSLVSVMNNKIKYSLINKEGK